MEKNLIARSNQLASLAVDIVINARRFRSTLRQTRGDLKKTADSSRGLATSITKIGLAASAFLIVQRAARLTIDVIVQTTLAFAKLEKQIIDIEKIAKINISEQFFGLAKELPSATFETISEVMAGAARAGIQGAEGIKEFSKAVIILSEVSGDIVPAEASIGIAQLLKNFDLGTDQALNLVNNIDTLSDNFVTTSGAILTTSKRLAGFAETVGFTVDELNAVVAALLQTGATATTVRTTLGQIFTKIIPKSLEAGRAMGLFGDELINFATIVGKGGVPALQLFISTLEKLPESKAQDFLKELGIAGSRTQLVLKLLIKSQKEQTRALELSANSINSTSGVLIKYNRVIKAADTEVKRLSKEWTLFKANLGNITVFKRVREALRGLNKDLKLIVPKKSLDNLKEVNERIKEITKQIVPLKEAVQIEEEIRNPRSRRPGVDKRSFDPVAALGIEIVDFLKGEHLFGNASKEARLADLLEERAVLIEISVALFKDQVTTAKNAKEEAARQLELDKELTKQKENNILRQKLFERDIIRGLPTLKTGFEAKLETQDKQRRKALEDVFDPNLIQMINERFNVLNQILFKSHSEYIREQVARRKTTELLERESEIRKKIGAISGAFGFAGKIGEAFELIQQTAEAGLAFRKAGFDPEGELGKSIDDIFKFKLKQLFAPEKVKPAQFKGLTQAWKDAITSVKKSDKEAELNKLNMKVGNALLKSLKGQNIPGILQNILDHLRQIPELQIK